MLAVPTMSAPAPAPPSEDLLSAFQQSDVPLSFGLVDSASAWTRLAGISVLCLDFNRDVRLAYKGKLPGKQSWSAEHHFEAIKARWLREETVGAELGRFLEPLQFVRMLTRYRIRAISGFLAYHPGTTAGKNSPINESNDISDHHGEPELHVIIQGSYMGMKDSLTNAMAWPVPFLNLLERLGLIGNATDTSDKTLKAHYGYSKIANQLYPQVQDAASALEQEGKPVRRIVVSGHSLGSAVGAGLLKLLKADQRFSEVQAVLFAQPHSFTYGHWCDFLKCGPCCGRQGNLDGRSPGDCMMKHCVLNIQNTKDPVVMASEVYHSLGTHVKFDGAPFTGEVRRHHCHCFGRHCNCFGAF